MSSARLREAAERYDAPPGDAPPGHALAGDHPSVASDPSAEPSAEPSSELFPESTLTALWLLGRVPAEALPWPLLRAGRAGRGPGPDVREAAFLLPSGVILAGDVEVHLRASDFRRHGHDLDPRYAGVVLHLCWEDDRPLAERGAPTPLPAPAGGGPGAPTVARSGAPTVALAATMRADRVPRLVALGPASAPPCAARRIEDPEGAARRLREEGRRRLAERSWQAWRLADRYGFVEALRMLLLRAVAATAGRRRADAADPAPLADAVLHGLGPDPVEALVAAARSARRGALVEAVRAPGIGPARASEIAWNAALPLVAALAAAYDDLPLARAAAQLADGWPAPRPYGRTRSLAEFLAPDATGSRPPSREFGALGAQGLLHLQDVWCSRGGCGVCPLSGPA